MNDVPPSGVRPAGRLAGFFRKRVGAPLWALFTQGTSPREIALCISLGAVISVFPLLGTTTFLCTVVAIRLRLNLPAIQAVNWLFAGVHLALIIPFMRLGERLFRDPPLPLAADELVALWRSDGWRFVFAFWRSIVHAIGGWAVTAVPVAVAAYFVMRAVLTRRRTEVISDP